MLTATTSKPRLRITTNDTQREQVIALLRQHNLPVSDIDNHQLLYLLLDGEKAIGTAGLEVFDDCALLRSVSVVKDEQGKGYGEAINKQVETYARENGINCLYLLTTTAKNFFDKQGYSAISREETPAAIKQSAEFASLCPLSAVVMKKRL